MAAAGRDSTEDWIVDPQRRPATVVELEGRIDTAIRVAEAAEAAALEIGAASLEAAEQARRAAAMAESAAAASQSAARSAAAAKVTPSPAPAIPTEPPDAARRGPGPRARRPAQPDPFDERLTAFRVRAERIVERLRRLDAPAPIS